MKNISQRNNHALMHAATSQPKNQSLQESVIVPPNKKLFSKKIPHFKKIKKFTTHCANLGIHKF